MSLATRPQMATLAVWMQMAMVWQIYLNKIKQTTQETQNETNNTNQANSTLDSDNDGVLIQMTIVRIQSCW